MGHFKNHLWHVLIALDQLGNAVLGGWADETLSSRIHRRATEPMPRRRWRVALWLVNRVFFWQANHCKSAFERERARAHLPQELQ